jgi:GNAT superfamily N-acetyltransferase
MTQTIKPSFGSTDDTRAKFNMIMIELQKKLELLTPFRGIYRTYGGYHHRDSEIWFTQEWGALLIRPTPKDDFNPNGLFSQKTMPDDRIIELRELYVLKEYRHTGIGTKVLKTLKSLCNKYDFSIAVLSGSIRFSKKVHDMCLQDDKEYFNRISTKPYQQWRKRGTLHGLKLKFFNQMIRVHKEKLWWYRNNVTNDIMYKIPKMWKEGEFHIVNELQIEDGKKIKSWYERNGFTTSLSYVSDWAVNWMRNEPIQLSNTGGDSYSIWYCDKHLKNIKNVKIICINTGTLKDSISLESTINYINFIQKYNRTDLPFKDSTFVRQVGVI